MIYLSEPNPKTPHLLDSDFQSKCFSNVLPVGTPAKFGCCLHSFGVGRTKEADDNTKKLKVLNGVERFTASFSSKRKVFTITRLQFREWNRMLM